MTGSSGSTEASDARVEREVRRIGAALGCALQNERQAAYLSQADLERLSGVGADLICRYETHRSTPTFTTIVLLARALKIRASGMLEGCVRSVRPRLPIQAATPGFRKVRMMAGGQCVSFATDDPRGAWKLIDMAVGLAIQEVRAQRGVNCQQVAACAGMGVATISVLERGNQQGSLATILKIAAALDVSIVDLIRRCEQLIDEHIQRREIFMQSHPVGQPLHPNPLREAKDRGEARAWCALFPNPEGWTSARAQVLSSWLQEDPRRATLLLPSLEITPGSCRQRERRRILPGVRQIKLHRSRALYDQTARRPVSHAKLARYLHSGTELRAIDARGEDITANVLISIFCAHGGAQHLSNDMLLDLIRCLGTREPAIARDMFAHMANQLAQLVPPDPRRACQGEPPSARFNKNAS